MYHLRQSPHISDLCVTTCRMNCAGWALYDLKMKWWGQDPDVWIVFVGLWCVCFTYTSTNMYSISPASSGVVPLESHRSIPHLNRKQHSDIIHATERSKQNQIRSGRPIPNSPIPQVLLCVGDSPLQSKPTLLDQTASPTSR